VRALGTVDTYVLSRSDFQRLEESCPTFSAQMRNHLDLLAMDSFLRKASPFARLPGEAIRRLAAQLHPMPVSSGETIIREGEDGDRFASLP